MDTMTARIVCLLILGEEWELLHLYEGQRVSTGESTELFRYMEVHTAEGVHRCRGAKGVNRAR